MRVMSGVVIALSGRLVKYLGGSGLLLLLLRRVGHLELLNFS